MKKKIKYLLAISLIFFIWAPINYITQVRSSNTLPSFLFIMNSIFFILFFISFVFIPILIIYYLQINKIKFLRIKNPHLRNFLLVFLINIVMFAFFQLTIFFGCVNMDPMCGYPIGPIYLISLPFLITGQVIVSMFLSNKEKKLRNPKVYLGGIIGAWYGIAGVFLAHFGVIGYPFLPSFWVFIIVAERLGLDGINAFLPFIPNIIFWTLIGIFIAKLFKRKKK